MDYLMTFLDLDQTEHCISCLNSPTIYCPQIKKCICSHCFSNLDEHEKNRQWFYNLEKKEFTSVAPSGQDLQCICLCKPSLKLFKIFKKDGCDLQQANRYGKNALTSVLSRDPTLELLVFLEENGLSLSKLLKSQSGAFLLHGFCHHSTQVSEKILKYFQKAGIGLLATNGSKQTILHALCKGKPSVESVSFLVRKLEINIDARDEFGKTALHYLCECNHVSVALLDTFLQMKAKFNSKSDHKEIPFHLYCKTLRPDFEIIKWFLERDKNMINKKDSQNFTPFSNLCRGTASLEIIRYCLHHARGNPNIADKNNLTPCCYIIHHFAYHGQKRNSEERNEILKVFINKNLKLNKFLYSKFTAFNAIACEITSDEIMKLCIEKGGNLNLKNEQKETPFYHICSHNPSLELLKLCIKKKANLNLKTRSSYTPFMMLCSGNVTLEMLELCVKNGANLNILTESKLDAFYFYCCSNSIDFKILQFFIKNDPNCIKQNYIGKYALYYICKEGIPLPTIKILKIFLKNNINENTQNKNRNQNQNENKNEKKVELTKSQIDSVKPLFKRGASLKVIKFLLGSGLHVNQKFGKRGKSLFHLLAEGNMSKETFHYLLESGLNIGERDLMLRTPLHGLCLYTDPSFELVELFIKYGADVNALDKYVESPLHLICQKKKLNFNILKLFLDNGGNIGIQNRSEWNVFHVLCKQNPSPEIIQLFLENGANKEAKHSFGCTPLQLLGRSIRDVRDYFFVGAMFKINWTALKDDFQLYFKRKEFTDSEINGIKCHSILLKCRLKKSLDEITNILNKYPSQHIRLFLRWVYCGEHDPKKNKDVDFKQMFKDFDIDYRDINKKRYSLKAALESLYEDEKSKDFCILVKKGEGKGLVEKEKEIEIEIVMGENEKEEDQNDNEKENDNEKGNDNDNGNEKENDDETKKIDNDDEYYKIKVHKFILQSRSGLFRGMFLNVENAQDLCQITDYTGKSIQSLKIFLRYLYTEKIYKDFKTIKDIEDELGDMVNYYQLNENCSFNFLINCIVDTKKRKKNNKEKLK
ncbi:ankyrin repeat ph and sec7 domain containing protein secg-related [Anaeramoeba flamelloides]|uniref:Ankyrin repeat ph and sec7 domain containing protein secg-related n=1 Tax=Anaeramoeba flamelloides TaxID=1746091 RepID=A0AAV8ABJ9_9EUKA|nr:ankyrin repeat ph and sec7 domain containing protein secg-related [Anaeramoeba flamelloides]